MFDILQDLVQFYHITLDVLLEPYCKTGTLIVAISGYVKSVPLSNLHSAIDSQQMTLLLR